MPVKTTIPGKRESIVPLALSALVGRYPLTGYVQGMK